jgi:hypothetical protein
MVRHGVITLLLTVLGSEASAQLIVYPAQGQSPEQQAKDQSECNAWAQQTTGVDPLVIAQQQSQPAPAQKQGGRARGAVGGAAAGAAVGAIAGDTGEGAAIGAVVGTMAGGMRQRRQNQEQESAAQAQAQRSQAALDTYARAVKTCMQGRNYTVN